MPETPRGLVVDANVLIDYQNSDFSVLGLVNQHVGPIHVLTPVLDEVVGVEAVDCEQIGLRVVEPSLAQVEEAGAGGGPLSFCDHLCLLFASEEGFGCIANDKPLRRECVALGVEIKWGLEIMLPLVRAGVLSAADAISTAEQIRASNPTHITAEIVERFSREARQLER